MKHIYLLLLFSLLSAKLPAENLRGFLLTKDDYRLTGYVNQINYIVTGLEIEFTNDFGDRYHIYPSLVKGFGFTKDGKTFRYVSRYHEGRWYFLEVIENKRHIDFYRLPDGSERYVNDNMLSIISESIPEFWIQVKGQKLLGISRVGFKKTMREYLEISAPGLAKKIGSKGFRYRDIKAIVNAFESNYRRSKQLL